jgi:hypothetical protein
MVVGLNLPSTFSLKKPVQMTLSEYYCNCLAAATNVYLTPDNGKFNYKI